MEPINPKEQLNNMKKWFDMTDERLKELGIQWDKGIDKSPDSMSSIPVSRGHQELLTELANVAIKQTQCWKAGLRARLRPNMPIIDFVMKDIITRKVKFLPYKAFIDNQGIVVVVQLLDEEESFKTLFESQWDIRKNAMSAAAEIAITVISVVETYENLRPWERPKMR